MADSRRPGITSVREEKEKLAVQHEESRLRGKAAIIAHTERNLKDSPDMGDDVDANFLGNQSIRNLPNVVEIRDKLKSLSVFEVR